MYRNQDKSVSNIFSGTVISWLLLGFVGGGMYGCPQYNVWQQGLAGEAELARADQNRKIRISQSKSKSEAAKYDAEAEIIRARGVSEANKIIADGLGGPEGYLRYLYIDSIKEANGKNTQVIYIPTEAGLPILEANRNKTKGEK